MDAEVLELFKYLFFPGYCRFDAAAFCVKSFYCVISMINFWILSSADINECLWGGVDI
jgi:hypothetical protein